MLRKDRQYHFTPNENILYNLWIGDRVKLRQRGNPIAEIKSVELVGRGHDNALYSIELNNREFKKVRSWNITYIALSPL